MRKLHIMSGLPASGKSTYCEAKAKENGDIVVHRDIVRQNLREFLGSKEYFPCSPDAEYAFYMTHIRIAANTSNKDIWIDQTTLSDGAFRKLISALDRMIDLTKFDISIEVLTTPYDICVERNDKRDGFLCVPMETMESMKRGFSISSDCGDHPRIPDSVRGRVKVNYIKTEDVEHG